MAVGAVGALFGAWKLRDHRKREALAARRAAASADALAAEIRAIIHQYGFATPDAAQRFVSEQPWTDAGLLAALDGFHGAAMSHDDQMRGAGRDGEVFAYYDSGLAGIGEVLAKRLTAPR